MSQAVIALLGRKDEPTDAVEEYCRYLAGALQPHEIQLALHRIPWEFRGWPEALQTLKLMATEWCDTWVLLQYTALAWSPRGFPQKVLRAMRILKSARARVGIVFHDVEPYSGTRLVDRARRLVQIRTMRRALTLADLAIFTVPPNKLSWPTLLPHSAVFVPVGVNLSIPAELSLSVDRPPVPTVGVFSITGGDPVALETQIILNAIRYAAQKIGRLRLSIIGRHAELREITLRDGLHDLPVELSVEGVVEPESVVRKLCACDVLLFVRGNISSRRGSAIAGIACGLPIIAFSGSETAPPLSEAGVLLVPPGQSEQISMALTRVLSDKILRANLAARSRDIYRAHFAWTAIGARFAAVLGSRT